MKAKNIVRVLARFTRAREAVSAMEYAVVVAIVAAGIGGAVWAFTDDVTDAVATVGDNLGTTAATAPTGSLAEPTE
jgi:Flp pilus assembly pilin Flp